LITENFSIVSKTLPRRRRPAVSIRRVAAAATFELDFDRIAGRPRLVESDHSLFAEQGVDHRALADVRPADDRHLDDIAGVLLRRSAPDRVRARDR
jgi:hypothetical protein